MDRTAHFSEAEKLDALEQQLKRYVAAGLTTIGDRGTNPEQIALYQKLKATGRLPIRAVLTWLANNSLPAAELESLGIARGPQFERILEQLFAMQLRGKGKTAIDRTNLLRHIAGIKPEPPKPEKPEKKSAKAASNSKHAAEKPTKAGKSARTEKNAQSKGAETAKAGRGAKGRVRAAAGR